MIWAILLLLGVVVAIHWFDYSRAVEEYTFAQPAGMADVGPTLLNDKTPIVVEVGALPWRPEVAGVASWVVETGADGEGTEMPVSAWVATAPHPEIANPGALAAEMGLETGLGELDGARPFWWMPGLQSMDVGVLRSGETLGLSWISAERRWVGCSAGEPLVLWLVHSRYRRFLPEEEGVDPWSLTVASAPWIGRVQFVEVRVRPGWCVGLPAHWGYAVRTEATKEGDTSWYWSAEQHSPLSWSMGLALSKKY
jgi:hypothetical protein